ncbi:MAG: SUMF1/EgtB/PvdO family nonheme iron enzyme [Brevinematales bacterium]|jgi:formylglycine-generating enzyme required for sulfatase activity
MKNVIKLFYITALSGILSSCQLFFDQNFMNKTVLNPAGSSASATTNYSSANIGTLVYVPAGTFQYDSGAGDLDTERAFHMSEYDITGTEFQNVTGISDPSSFSSVPNHPVDSETWYQAIYFCNKLSILEGLTPAYSIGGSTDPSAWGTIPAAGTDSPAWDAVQVNWSASGYRLPTEMEWMWAAMGATSDARSGDITGWGVNTGGYTKGYAGSTESGGAQNNVSQYALINNTVETEAVGLLKPNELGLYDMSGNVWQWCWDWLGGTAEFTTSGTPWGTPSGAQTGYAGPASGASRVFRGGAYADYPVPDAYIYFRNYDSPGASHTAYGFRVVRP